jgi:methyl-accepting chemotaxis protein-1 (serine sensor receptor)
MLTKGITIKARIGLTMAFLAALLLIIGVLGLTGMSRANQAHHETFTNQMPSAVDIGNAEMYAARERLALDRAAFLLGTPDSASAVERARVMRTTSDAWWKKYYDLPRGTEEDRLAQDVVAKRDAVHQSLDAFAAVITANDQSKIGAAAKELQVRYNDLSVADDALNKLQFAQAQQGFDASQDNFVTFRLVSIGAVVVGLLAALFS